MPAILRTERVLPDTKTRTWYYERGWFSADSFFFQPAGLFYGRPVLALEVGGEKEALDAAQSMNLARHSDKALLAEWVCDEGMQ